MTYALKSKVRTARKLILVENIISFDDKTCSNRLVMERQ